MPRPAVKRSPSCEIRVAEDNKTGKTIAPLWVQVARQGNPLFNEGLVAVVDKDLYSRTSPSDG